MSPLRGTYCGFSGYGTDDMQKVIDLLPTGKCTIKLAPSGHDQRLFAESMNVLVRNGFLIDVAELNYEREVTDSFLSQVSKGNQKCYWRKAHDTKLPPYSFLGVSAGIFSLISDNRKRKGNQLSMSFEQICEMHFATNSVISFLVPDNSAAAICIRLSPDILYVYAWGDADNEKNSPTVYLAAHIYEYCLHEKIRLLDIGTATEKDGTPNFGLMAFKERLGFTPSLKLTMVRHA